MAYNGKRGTTRPDLSPDEFARRTHAARKPRAHPGFKGASQQVAAREGIPLANAERIIGAGKARASAAARKANPRLNRTGGKR